MYYRHIIIMVFTTAAIFALLLRDLTCDVQVTFMPTYPLSSV